jgi:hypothetical protein
MALTAAQSRNYEVAIERNSNSLPVKAATVVYGGGALSRNVAGDLGPLVDTESFAGFATQTIDNAAGAAGDKDVRIRERGGIELDVVGVAGKGDVEEDVYAADDNTFTLTVGTNLKIGKIKRFISGTKCIVLFESEAVRSA